MSDNYEATIAELQTEITERMKAVNSLRRLRGLPLLYPDQDAAALPGSGSIRSDQWYRKALSTAVREFLEMRSTANLGAASVDEIYSALAQGGFKFDTKDETYAKPALRQSLTKNTAIFHRLPNGDYGLATWYDLGRNGADDSHPNPIRTKRKPGRPSKKKALDHKPNPPVKPSNLLDKMIDDRSSKNKVTLSSAVKEAIEAMVGEFTKQDILDWIIKNHPALGSPNRTSVFSMIPHFAKELHLEIAREAKGNEPAAYRKAK
jgi:hypothetical protein